MRTQLRDFIFTTPAPPKPALALASEPATTIVGRRPKLPPPCPECSLPMFNRMCTYCVPAEPDLEDPPTAELSGEEDPGEEEPVDPVLTEEFDNATYTTLASDPDPEVRINLAHNEHLPLELLNQLCNDPDQEVRHEARLARSFRGPQ